LAKANVTNVQFFQSYNGWSKFLKWEEHMGNESNVMAVFSDNGGRTYTAIMNICPGGFNSFAGAYGQESWVFCEIRNPGTGHTDVWLQELRTATATPYNTLRNVSNSPQTDSTPLYLSVNGVTGEVDWAWREAGDGIIPACYRC
jgi:hypothetical protein